MNQIDEIDRQILAELQVDGRLTMKALAQRIGLSSPAMIERVRRLEKLGVIEEFRAWVRPQMIGRPYGAVISAQVPPRQAYAFLTAVREEDSVSECLRLTGEMDYWLRLNLTGPEHLEQVVDRLRATGAECVANVILSTPVPLRPITLPDPTAANPAPSRQRVAKKDA